MKDELLKKLQQITEQNVMDIEARKASGDNAIGFYCLFAPTELAVAADSVPLPLCGTRQDPIEAAEEILPRNLCPLIKSSFGFGVSDTCPFFRFSDLIVADTTCDGKKKMFELMADFKPVHVLQLPQQAEEKFMDSWIGEIQELKTRLEQVTGRNITEEKLRGAIRLMNRERAAKTRLMDVTRSVPSPLTGMELLEILFKSGFFADKEKGIALMNEIAEACEAMTRDKVSPFTSTTPRILLTGVPIGLGSDKVVKIIEKSGASVVAFENCSGYKNTFQVDESMEPIEALARQYLSIPCSVMSPNPGRMELLDRMLTDFSVDGVVDLTWQACHTYNIEASTIRDFVTEQHGLPYLHIETDYAESDTEQLRVRIEAFLEMI
ncbi:MAG: 2-hydroxyacyl-CoA dehydratase family protein [Desulfobacterales bacterium]|nr:2-hydroxyacyl-CoA dehydratase family protein [Desulfobacterales bacterium]